MSMHDEAAKIDDSGWIFPTVQISSPEHLSHENVEQTDDLPDKDQPKSQTPFQQSIRRLLRDKRAVISLGIIVFLILLAIVGPPIYQHIGTPYTNDVGQQVGPEVYHNPFW